VTVSSQSRPQSRPPRISLLWPQHLKDRPPANMRQPRSRVLPLIPPKPAAVCSAAATSNDSNDNGMAEAASTCCERPSTSAAMPTLHPANCKVQCIMSHSGTTAAGGRPHSASTNAASCNHSRAGGAASEWLTLCTAQRLRRQVPEAHPLGRYASTPEVSDNRCASPSLAVLCGFGQLRRVSHSGLCRPAAASEPLTATLPLSLLAARQ